VFSGTGLDSVLRAQAVTTVVLAGVSTDVAIACSTTAAVDLGYRVVVPDDCVEEFDPEVHRRHLDRTLPVLATMRSGDAVLAALAAGPDDTPRTGS
jgi:nicotinamidase-related amidase